MFVASSFLVDLFASCLWESTKGFGVPGGWRGDVLHGLTISGASYKWWRILGAIGVDLFSRLGGGGGDRSHARERSDRAGGGCGRGDTPSHGRDFFPKLEYKNRILEHLQNDFLGN